MKSRRASKKAESLTVQVGRALRRAAKAARKHARMHGTAVCYMRDGKIVTEKP